MLQLNDIRKSKVYQEALDEGREEGREEGIESVARRMLEQKLAIKKIAELTGLSLETIKGLRKAPRP